MKRDYTANYCIISTSLIHFLLKGWEHVFLKGTEVERGPEFTEGPVVGAAVLVVLHLHPHHRGVVSPAHLTQQAQRQRSVQRVRQNRELEFNLQRKQAKLVSTWRHFRSPAFFTKAMLVGQSGNIISSRVQAVFFVHHFLRDRYVEPEPYSKHRGKVSSLAKVPRIRYLVQ